MLTLDVLSELSSTCWMVVGTPSGLCCHWASITAMSAGVPFWILKHSGCFDLVNSCTHCMSVCISHMCAAGGIISMTSAVSLKNGSIIEHRSNHCALLWMVQPRGQGNWPIWDQGTAGLLQAAVPLFPGDLPGVPALASMGMGQPQDSVFHCNAFHHNSVHYPLPLLTEGGVSKCITWQACQVIFFKVFNVAEGPKFDWGCQSFASLSLWDSVWV